MPDSVKVFFYVKYCETTQSHTMGKVTSVSQLPAIFGLLAQSFSPAKRLHLQDQI